jgi:glycosyltransferase involved in cell wall biosynthesis
MTPNLRLSVVIPVHDNGSTLDAQLRAVVSSIDESMEVVVVDNDSRDSSRDIAEAWARRCDQVRVVVARERASEGYARNVGVATSTGDAIAFCDGDDVVDAGWARAMATSLRDADFVTGPVRVDGLNPPWLASSRGVRLFQSLPMLFDTIPFAHGCNFGVRREVLAQAGPFAEDMKAGMDIEYSIRLWRAGVSLHWCPDAAVDYRLRADRAGRWRQAVAYGRAQRAIRSLVPEIVVRRSVAVFNLKRALWLARNLFRLTKPDLRARWLWTCGILFGELLEEFPGSRQANG